VRVSFKGGNSLAKGSNLIRRFTEDIDIFLVPLASRPELGKRAIDRELKKLRNSVGAHPALTFDDKQSQTIGGFPCGWSDGSDIRAVRCVSHQSGRATASIAGLESADESCSSSDRLEVVQEGRPKEVWL